jgi:CRISPR-associated protein Cas2
MRIIVFFDLPMESLTEKRAYNHFRKFLIKNGFFQMQKSIYTKLAINRTVSTSIKNMLRKNPPKKGLVQVLEITENQYTDMEFITGESTTNVLNTDKRLVRFD